MQIHHACAKDNGRGIYLGKSSGRRRAGRPARYAFAVPTGRYYRYVNPHLRQAQMEFSDSQTAEHVFPETVLVRFTAFDDDEAIEKANKRLAKALESMRPAKAENNG